MRHTPEPGHPYNVVCRAGLMQMQWVHIASGLIFNVRP